MCSDDAGVGEDQRVVALLRQGMEYPLPNPPVGPNDYTDYTPSCVARNGQASPAKARPCARYTKTRSTLSGHRPAQVHARQLAKKG